MEDVAAAAPKKSTTLSVDRAAFLLLRVKKAFKKKRQQRKEKQQQTYNSAAIASQSRSNRKVPPPLLRSRTLPAIIVPGIPVLSLHTEKNTFQFEERVGAKSGGNRCWSLLTRHSPHTASNVNLGYGYNSQQNCCTINNNNTVTIKSLNLPKDDTTLVYRRKSSGSTPHSVGGIGSTGSSSSTSGVHATAGLANNAAIQQHALYSTTDAASFMHTSTSDEFECHADGTLMLRIPAPHVVAARAYRLASKKHTTTSTTDQHSHQHQHQHQQRTSADTHQSTHDTSTTSGSSSGSSSTANTAFTRLAKLLHQTSSATLKPTASSSHTHVDSMHMSLAVAPSTGEEAPRRLSWERIPVRAT
ncbi:uncharacterized protein LOC119676839 [Teleopsis dalmanni]|uniref:uncharacterized protein LOC119676839 n=1 Tax=Teleopsis dalmanni TaxID=139649 RepID=UPI0018CEC393|nr:uncharacterized protein LOC119676839 [Teleopsis dalmanni]